jgi:hypothetical protein
VIELHLSGMKARNGTLVFVCSTCKVPPNFSFGARASGEMVYLMLWLRPGGMGFAGGARQRTVRLCEEAESAARAGYLKPPLGRNKVAIEERSLGALRMTAAWASLIPHPHF